MLLALLTTLLFWFFMTWGLLGGHIQRRKGAMLVGAIWATIVTAILSYVYSHSMPEAELASMVISFVFLVSLSLSIAMWKDDSPVHGRPSSQSWRYQLWWILTSTILVEMVVYCSLRIGFSTVSATVMGGVSLALYEVFRRGTYIPYRARRYSQAKKMLLEVVTYIGYLMPIMSAIWATAHFGGEGVWSFVWGASAYVIASAITAIALLLGSMGIMVVLCYRIARQYPREVRRTIFWGTLFDSLERRPGQQEQHE